VKPEQRKLADSTDLLLDVLPAPMRVALLRHPDLESLVEVVLDLGRPPEARFPDNTVWLGDEAVTREDLAHTTARLGAFTSDNRAGIERTLHRISAIRNRSGDIVGLTCRVGRAIFGTVEVIRDVVESGKSILLLGPPGIGKTTLLREAARVLADEFGRRVVVVDTSNEIGGDGDIPHPGIGRARRMQVASPERQHAVMIEAVENHMPEVIVIDEIGTEAEAAAARTIAERGVQLVATAHGHSLDNLLSNPTLADLLGGIQPVTLGDDEARRRHTQKTVLERKQAPTFDVLIEIEARDRFAVHHEVARVVDAFLRGTPEPGRDPRALRRRRGAHPGSGADRRRTSGCAHRRVFCASFPTRSVRSASIAPSDRPASPPQSPARHATPTSSSPCGRTRNVSPRSCGSLWRASCRCTCCGTAARRRSRRS
jgi:stage III sporulation protein SpoIIIAA